MALLLAEILGLTLRFDAGTLKQDRQWWADLVRQAHFAPQIASAVLIVLLVFGGARWGEEVKRWARQRGDFRRLAVFLVAHLVAFLGFAALTRVVLEGDIRAAPHPEAWVLAWAAVGAGAAVLWLGALLPPGLWLALGREGLGLLLVGVLLGLAALEAGRWTLTWWEPLGRSTLWLVNALLSRLCGETLYDPDTFRVGTPRFWVEVAPSCSGYEGIGLICVFLLFFLWFYRTELRLPQALLLFPVGVAVMWLANALRITGLILLGTYDPEVAAAGFHSQAGWLAFNGVALGLLWGVRRSRWLVRGEPPAVAEQPNATLPYLVPLFVLLASLMVTRALSHGFDQLYPLRVLAVAAVLWLFRGEYRRWPWKPSWEAVALGVLAFGLWMALEPPSAGLSPWSPAAGLSAGWAGAWVAFRVAGLVITVPLAEELAFRGYLTRRLLAADFRQVPPGQFSWFSFLFSSLLFGALHTRWLAGTLTGMLYALALYRRRRVADAVWAHATTNALIAAYVLGAGEWGLLGS